MDSSPHQPFDDSAHSGPPIDGGTLRTYAISVFIVLTLVLQTLAVLKKLPPNLWPFLNYPMYCTAHAAGEEIVSYAVYGRATSGEEVEILDEDLGINRFKFQRGFVRAIRDHRPDRAAAYVDMYLERHGRALESVRVTARPVVWTDGQPHPKPERTVASITLAAVAPAR